MNIWIFLIIVAAVAINCLISWMTIIAAMGSVHKNLVDKQEPFGGSDPQLIDWMSVIHDNIIDLNEAVEGIKK